MYINNNILNHKFGMLYVVEYVGNGKYKCICDCGNEKIVDTCNLKRIKSCGCYRSNRAKTIKKGKIEKNFSHISKHSKSGYSIRVLGVRKWAKTYEEAVKIRDEMLKELGK